MEGDDLDNARYPRMRWNVPLSEEHAGLLLDRLSLRPGARVVDLGCGWGELLLRVVASTDQAIGTGVDTDARALGRARRRAADRHLDRQVLFAEAGIAGWDGPDDRVRWVGGSPGLRGASAALPVTSRAG